MEEKDIQQLLNRYLDGQTTEQEERQLDEFFSYPEQLEKKLSRQIDKWNMVEKTTERRARTLTIRWIAGVAASLLLLFGTILMVRQNQETRAYASYEDTYDNPEDAAAETHRALLKFSETIDKGLEKLDK